MEKFLKGSVTLFAGGRCSLILIAVLGLFAYSNTFNVPFTHDDIPNIVENPIIKDLRYFVEPSRAGVFTGSGQNLRFKERYIGYLSFALNYKVHGLDVTGFHIINLSIHLLNAMLVYFLVILTFRTPWLSGSSLKEISKPIALFTALVFVSHPLQTQAVTYIVQRFTSLAAMFYLLSLVAYIKSRIFIRGRTRYALYGLSLVSAVLAMKTKEMAFTLPLTVTFYEFMFFNGKSKKRTLYLTPLLLTMLIIPLTLIDINKPLGEIIGDASEETIIRDIPRLDYLLTEFRVIVSYIRLLLLPVNQNLDYDYMVYHSFFDPQVFLSFLFLLSVFGLGGYLLKRSRTDEAVLRMTAFGLFWFFITLSVESGIIPLFPICEHRVYLPSVGAFLATISGVFLLREKLKNKKIQAAITLSLIVIPLVLSPVTYARNTVWRSEISLWEDVVRKSPFKARPHNNLGLAYASKGLTDKAVEHYRTALRFKPDYVRAHNNLGVIYFNKGWVDRATEHYKTALRLKPGFAKAHNNLALVYGSKGLIDKAIVHFQIALKLKPDYEEAHYNIGVSYFNKGWIDKAIKHFQTALKLKPDSAEAYNNLALSYGSKGLFDKAIEHFRIALKMKPDYTDAHFNLGLVYLEKGLMEKAQREFEAVLQINPDYQKARQYLNQTIEIQSH